MTLAQKLTDANGPMPASQTLDYYNANAQAFAASTVSVDFSATQRRFAQLPPPGARILDFGCG